MDDGALTKKTIWILEDEEECRFIYSEILENEYDLVFFSSISDFKQKIDHLKDNQSRADLFIVDIRLPDGSFTQLIKNQDIETFLNGIPLLVVSSFDEFENLNFYFDNGAVDFLTKPFSKNELLVKVARYIKQKESAHSHIKVDQNDFTVSCEGAKSSQLTQKEFQIILALLNSSDTTLTKQELLNKVWGNLKVSPKSLDVHLYNIRGKLAPANMTVKFHTPDKYQLSDNRMDIS